MTTNIAQRDTPPTPGPVYLLCRWGGDWHEWYVEGWHTDKQALEAVALRLCWEEYRRDKAKNDASTNPNKPTILSPDEIDFRRYFVEEVAHASLGTQQPAGE